MNSVLIFLGVLVAGIIVISQTEIGRAVLWLLATGGGNG